MPIKDELKNYIAAELLSGYEAADLGDDDSLLADGMVDSLGAVRLLDFIGQRFGFQIPPEDLTVENFRSVGLIAAYLEKRLASDGV